MVVLALEATPTMLRSGRPTQQAKNAEVTTHGAVGMHLDFLEPLRQSSVPHPKTGCTRNEGATRRTIPQPRHVTTKKLR